MSDGPAVKLTMRVEVTLGPPWADPDLSAADQVRYMLDEYPHPASLLAEVLDGDAAGATATLDIEVGGELAGGAWQSERWA